MWSLLDKDMKEQKGWRETEGEGCVDLKRALDTKSKSLEVSPDHRRAPTGVLN